MTDRRKLLPCPFCGSAPVHAYSSGIFCVTDDCPINGVHCMDATQWNTRTTRPAADRKEVARIIDPSSFKCWDVIYRVGLNAGDTDDEAKRRADRCYGADCDRALAKADVILSLRATTAGDEDEAYEIGKRDGFEEAIQELDVATGGDGEFLGSTFPGGTVDVPAMKARIMERFIAPSVTTPTGEANTEDGT